MENTPRTYTKTSPERDIKPSVSGKRMEPVEGSHSGDVISPAGYQKGEGTQSPKSFWVIVSGGEKRERTYFNVLLKSDSFKRIKLDFIADINRLNPNGMLETAIELKERYATSSSDNVEPDRFYLISDVDHFYNELVEITPICEAEGFNLIISNSCFEVWLFYAYFGEIPTFPIPADPSKISGKFKGWLNGIISGGVQTNKAIFAIRQNITNAKVHFKLDENNIPSLFSTSMFKLAEDLLPLIEEDIEKLMEVNQGNERKGREGKVV